MANYIQAIPTEHGLSVLKSQLKETATTYILYGAESMTAEPSAWKEFYRHSIESSFYDENGILTFVLNLPIEDDLKNTLHKILIVDDNDQAVIDVLSPKIYLGKGIGGLLTLKATIKGEAGEVVFKSSEFITEPEMQSIWLPPIYEKFAEHVNAEDPHEQYLKKEDIIDALKNVVSDIRLGSVSTAQVWRGYGFSDVKGYVITGVVNGAADEYIDTINRRPLQKLINGQWFTVGAL